MESDYDVSNVCVHLSPAYLSLISFLKVRNHFSPVVIADCCLQLYFKKCIFVKKCINTLMPRWRVCSEQKTAPRK